MTLKEELRMVKSWMRSAGHEIDERQKITEDMITKPVPLALKMSEGHDPSESTVCSCGKVKEGTTYREHLVKVLDRAALLKVPPYAAGEGW